MFLSNLKILAVVLTALLAATGAALQPAGAPADLSWVDKRIQEILPTAKEKRFDEIGWAKGLRAAERLARENNRPVFLFCNVGQLDIGRC